MYYLFLKKNATKRLIDFYSLSVGICNYLPKG